MAVGAWLQHIVRRAPTREALEHRVESSLYLLVPETAVRDVVSSLLACPSGDDVCGKLARAADGIVAAAESTLDRLAVPDAAEYGTKCELDRRREARWPVSKAVLFCCEIAHILRGDSEDRRFNLARDHCFVYFRGTGASNGALRGWIRRFESNSDPQEKEAVLWDLVAGVSFRAAYQLLFEKPPGAEMTAAIGERIRALCAELCESVEEQNRGGE